MTMERAVRNPWTVLSSTEVYETDWHSVREHKVRDAAGRESVDGVAHFKHAVIRILPVDREGFANLVGQYRFGAGYFSWEWPAGGGDPGEPPHEAARRELEEEIGLNAAHWLPMLDLVPSGL
jgi:8-oxo-dGTP pyrophosphatase MutT (NUDIX family)